jgi:hypothetical protein
MRPAPEHEHDAVEEDRVREQHRALAHVEPRRHAAHAGHERHRDVADCSRADAARTSMRILVNSLAKPCVEGRGRGSREKGERGRRKEGRRT